MSEPINIPPALVLGCNTPHGIGALADWIEEQSGYPPEFFGSGWTDWYYYANTISSSSGDGDGYSDIFKTGYGYSNYCGDGYGYGNMYSSSLGDGYGFGYSYGDGWGNGGGNRYTYK